MVERLMTAGSGKAAGRGRTDWILGLLTDGQNHVSLDVLYVGQWLYDVKGMGWGILAVVIAILELEMYFK
jgi:hypothetical protein